jgi:hypothetical protein
MTIRRCVAYRNDFRGTLTFKGQGPMKVITVRDTPPYGHAPTYRISLTYLERQKCYGPGKKILLKKQNCFLISIIQLIMCNLLLY